MAKPFQLVERAESHGPRSATAGVNSKLLWHLERELVLFAAKEEEEFDDKDDDYGKFEDEAAGLVELVDHETVEFAGGAEFLVNEGAVVGNADFDGNQVIEARV